MPALPLLPPQPPAILQTVVAETQRSAFPHVATDAEMNDLQNAVWAVYVGDSQVTRAAGLEDAATICRWPIGLVSTGHCGVRVKYHGRKATRVRVNFRIFEDGSYKLRQVRKVRGKTVLGPAISFNVVQ